MRVPLISLGGRLGTFTFSNKGSLILLSRMYSQILRIVLAAGLKIGVFRATTETANDEYP